MCGYRLGVDAERAEARGEIIDPLRRISCATRSAAGRDHENFAMNRSPTAAVDDCHSGSSLPTGSGTVMVYPLSSGATARSA
jgi:hypothetical protein